MKKPNYVWCFVLLILIQIQVACVLRLECIYIHKLYECLWCTTTVMDTCHCVFDLLVDIKFQVFCIHMHATNVNYTYY